MRKIILITFVVLSSLVGRTQYLDLDWNTQDNCQHQTIIYHDNGVIKEVGCVNDSLRRIGEWSMYSSQGMRIALCGFDTEGMRHGAWIIWDSEGDLVCEMLYTHGERTGIWKHYKEDGTIQEKVYTRE